MRPAATTTLKHLLARGLLALALVFVQQHAVLHWLSHATDATQAKAAGKPAPADPCDECVQLAGLGSAAVGGDGALPSSTALHVLAALPAPTTAALALLLAFESRAPPILT